MMEREHKLVMEISSMSGGKLNQRLVLEEYSDEANYHVAKNFALVEAVVPATLMAFKKLAEPFLK